MARSEPQPQGVRFAAVVTALFAIVGAAGAFRHEMWRDELQAWLVARDVPLPALFHHLRYEGHPSVWYLLLKPLAWASWWPASMQVLHLALGIATVWVVARYAPWPRAARALFAFGYFPLFEYLLICRNYAAGILVIVVAAALWPRRRERPLALGLLIAVMAHTSVHAAVVAIAFLTALAAEIAVELAAELRHGGAAAGAPGEGGGGGQPWSSLWLSRRRRLVAIGIGVAAVGLAVLQLRPPPDSGWGGRMAWAVDGPGLLRVLGDYAHAFAPLPRSVPSFWHTFAVDDLPVVVKLALAVAVIAGTVVALAASWRALAFFLCGTAALAVLFTAVYPGSIRHHGFFFVIWLVAIWLARADAEPVAATARRGPRALALALMPLLALQVVAGFRAYAADFKQPFSPAKQAAAFIRRHGLAGRPLAGMVDAPASGVLAEIPARRIFYPEPDRFGSYVLWDDKRLPKTGAQAVAATLRRAAPGEEWLLVMSVPLDADLIRQHGIEELARFRGVVDHWEAVIVLYLLRAPA